MLLGGHLTALCAAGWMMETHERLSRAKPETRSTAVAGLVMATAMAGTLLYSLYPMVRMLLTQEEPFIVGFDSIDPARRFSTATCVAYGVGAASVLALIVAVRDLCRTSGSSANGLAPAMVGVFAVAPLAMGLHLAFGLRPELAEHRNALALAIVAIAAVIGWSLRPRLIALTAGLGSAPEPAD